MQQVGARDLQCSVPFATVEHHNQAKSKAFDNSMHGLLGHRTKSMGFNTWQWQSKVVDAGDNGSLAIQEAVGRDAFHLVTP